MKLVATKFDSMYGRTYCTEYTLETEKTLRDEFAMAAVQGYLARSNLTPKEASEASYRVANAMMEAREKL